VATRGLHFFMMPDEFTPLIWQIAETRRLCIIMEWFGFGMPLEERQHRDVWAIAREPGLLIMPHDVPADRLWLAVEPPRFEVRDLRHLLPGKWGWVMVDVPQFEGHALLMAQVGAKSDWYDREQQQVFENPASLALFPKIATPIRNRLQRPTWAYMVNVPSTGRARAYRDVGYTVGTTEWERSGGELKQRGVENVRYTTQPPSRL
jgi:hypothetical protein